jgi:hypothetical protein
MHNDKDLKRVIEPFECDAVKTQPEIASCTLPSSSDPTIAVIVEFVHVALLIGRAQAGTARRLYEGETTV